MEDELMENYRALVASGASRWDIVEQQARAVGALDVAEFAAAEAKEAGHVAPEQRPAPTPEDAAEARAAADVTGPPKGRKAAHDSTQEG